MFTSYGKMFFTKILLHLISFSVSFINLHNCDNYDTRENVRETKGLKTHGNEPPCPLLLLPACPRVTHGRQELNTKTIHGRPKDQ